MIQGQPSSHPFPEPIIEPLPTRRCADPPRGCGEVLPIDQFKLDSAHPNYCNKCRNKNGSEIRVKRETEAARDENIKGFIAKTKSREIKAPHITELAEAMIDEFHGLKRFAKFYVGNIKKASRNKNFKTAIDGCKSIATIIKASTENRTTAPDVAHLNDEDIERELRELQQRIGAEVLESQMEAEDA